MTNTSTIEASARPARVLVFTVDDAGFCIDLDWVETVYQRHDVLIHNLTASHGISRGFLVHHGEPALLVDLREALGMSDLLGPAERAVLVIVRTGALVLGLQADGLVGVRHLDLGSRAPIPAALQRDGGFTVGHLVELDGRIHSLLEPTRILSPGLRESLEPFWTEACAFCDRRNRLTELAATLRRDPTLRDLKSFARLARRNGRTLTAAATRAVVRAIQGLIRDEVASPMAGALTADNLMRALVGLDLAKETGELEVELAKGQSGTIFLTAGRVADACLGSEHGRLAFRQLLSATDGSFRFARSESSAPPRIEDSTVWLLIETLEQMSTKRRGQTGN